MAGFVIFTLASAICGIAPGLGTLIAGRVLQGVGAAVLVPCSLALLNNTFREPQARAKAIALWAGGASVALALGPLVGSHRGRSLHFHRKSQPGPNAPTRAVP